MPTVGTKKAAKSKSTKATANKEALYPKVSMKIFYGETPLSAAQAKNLLGWTEIKGEEEGTVFLVDTNGKSIALSHNHANRPYRKLVADTYKQEHLRKRWKANGEPIIIGQSGEVLDGQHRLISLVLAAQEWKSNREKFPEWETEPTMEQLVVYGISEDDSVVNTINTGVPRSLADVIFRSDLFTKTSGTERKKLARMTDYAIRFLWQRTGAMKEAFGLKRTHSESLNFLERHPRILECVKIISEEDEEGEVGLYLSPGYAAGLLYLMGSSSSDPKAYHSSSSPQEDLLKWDNWDKACDFWVKLSKGDKTFGVLREALGNILQDEESETVTSTLAERIGYLAKAWELYSEGAAITKNQISLMYESDTVQKKLAETPTVGGIDLGNPEDKEDVAAGETSTEEAPKKSGEKREEAEESPEEEGEPIEQGYKIWVASPGKEPFSGNLVEKGEKKSMVRIDPGFKGAGTIREVLTAHLLGKKPA